MKALYAIVLLEVLFSLALFVLSFFFLSPIVLGQKSSPALSFVDGRQDRWTRNINICVGMNKQRLTPEALEQREERQELLSLPHFNCTIFLLPDDPTCESVLWSVSLFFLPFDVNVQSSVSPQNNNPSRGLNSELVHAQVYITPCYFDVLIQETNTFILFFQDYRPDLALAIQYIFEIFFQGNHKI